MTWMDKWVRDGLKREQDLVTRPGDPTYLLRSVLALGLVGGLSYLLVWQDGWVQILAQVVLAGIAGWAASTGLRVKLAYRNGWLDGRRHFVASLEECQRNGVPPQVWLDTEYQRDMRIMGVDPYPGEAPPGHPDHLD